MRASALKHRDLSVYLITKPSTKVKANYFEILELVLKGGGSVLQWREKDGDTGELYNHAKKVQALAKKYVTPLIINDRLDIALALDADGLHVGQNDLPATIARKLLGPNKILGVSAGNLEEALKAEADGADYLGVGALYPTGSKQDATPISLEAFKEICKSVKIPVVAIGGITGEKIPEIIAHGASGVALISSIWDQNDPTDAVLEIKQEWSKATK